MASPIRPPESLKFASFASDFKSYSWARPRIRPLVSSRAVQKQVILSVRTLKVRRSESRCLARELLGLRYITAN